MDSSLALELLSEGLDLCVRARKLDEAITRAAAAGRADGGTRCLTPALWVQDAYDRDLAAWEERARAFVGRHLPFSAQLRNDKSALPPLGGDGT